MRDGFGISMRIRNSVKAVIVKNGKILCNKCKDSRGVFYGLPGGGQEPGETMPEALRRECREEIGTDVIVHDLVLVREFIGSNHDFAKFPDVHQVELTFSCDLVEDCKMNLGDVPDELQIGIEWLDLDSLENYQLYPLEMRSFLKGLDFHSKTYLGDIC